MVGQTVRLVVAVALLAAAIVWWAGATRTERAAGPGRAWTAGEAEVWSMLALIDGLRADGEDPLSTKPDLAVSNWVPGFSSSWHRWRDGTWHEDASPNPNGEPWVVYVAPLHRTGASTFCLTSAGQMLIDVDHHDDDGVTAPSADAACAANSAGTPRDFLEQVGTGRNGHVWQSRKAFDTTTLEVLVRDDAGNPLPQAKLRLLTAEEVRLGAWERTPGRPAVLPVDAPIGLVLTDQLGRGTITGPAMPGAHLAISIGFGFCVVEAGMLHSDDARCTITIPNGVLLAESINENESRAISVLKNLSSAQAQCQASGAIDADRNGAGEYGFLGELSGSRPLRAPSSQVVGPDGVLHPPTLSSEFGRVVDGAVEYSGYVFSIYLPDLDNRPVREPLTWDDPDVSVGTAHAELLWCAYAWPVDHGRTGVRAFFISQSGDVLSTRNLQGYSGRDNPPPPTAAFLPGNAGTLDSQIAAHTEGSDGSTWNIVQ